MIQKALQDPLAEKILAGEMHDGETVTIGVGPQGLTIGAQSKGKGKAKVA